MGLYFSRSRNVLPGENLGGIFWIETFLVLGGVLLVTKEKISRVIKNKKRRVLASERRACLFI